MINNLILMSHEMSENLTSFILNPLCDKENTESEILDAYGRMHIH